MVHFGGFLKTRSLRSNSVTRQINFNRKMPKFKCDILSNFQTMWNGQNQKESKMAALVLLYYLYTQTERTGPSKMTESRMFSSFSGYKTQSQKQNVFTVFSDMGTVSIKSSGQRPQSIKAFDLFLKTRSHGQ